MGYVRQILLFVISVAMVVVGLLLLAFDLLAAMPRSRLLFVAAGAALGIVLWLAITTLSFIGLYLLWEDFIAPLFARRGMSVKGKPWDWGRGKFFKDGQSASGADQA